MGSTSELPGTGRAETAPPITGTADSQIPDSGSPGGERGHRSVVPLTPDFKAFDSIPRLFRACIVTEKIDGTNAIVHISDDGLTVTAGSRTRWIKPGDDNHGFATWVAAHAGELRSMGPGYHYGEWWGAGIQRRYGLKEKRFCLFNVGRWGEGGKDADKRPACCGVVPILWRGTLSTPDIFAQMDSLATTGSHAAPGFMDPEGIVVWHEAGRVLFKATLGDDGHKGAAK